MPQLANISNFSDHSDYLITAPDVQEPLTKHWFNIQHWYQQDAVIGESTAQSLGYVFQTDKQKYMLRHYQGAGLMSKIAQNGYLYLGVKKSTAYLEFEMLLQMQALGLPIPKPIAARLSRQLLHYRADIIMQLMDDASDLIGILLKRSLKADEWQSIGKTIAKFHQNGVHHAHLNIHNIILDSAGKVWLIDFESSKFKPKSRKWQQANLKRLLHSFEKEKRKYPNLNWSMHNWHTVVHAYQSQLNKDK